VRAGDDQGRNAYLQEASTGVYRFLRRDVFMMKDEDKTREQLMAELAEMRLKTDELDQSGRELKRLEEELKAARDFAKELIQTANILVVGLDTQGNLRMFNPAAEEITGYTMDELKGKNWCKVMVPQAGYEQICREFSGLLNDRVPRKFDNSILTRSGEERYIAWRNSVLVEQGEITGTISFGMDITERKMAEEALKQSEELYRAIFENTGTATVVLEKDKTISLVNTEYEKLSGYCREEIEGKKRWTEFVAQEDLEGLLSRRGRREGDESPDRRRDEFRFVDRHGAIKYVVLCFDSIPGTSKTIASLLDITELKRAEETLRESQREQADIIEFFPDATMVVDQDGKVTAWNRAMEALTGIRAEDMLGRGNYEYAIPFCGRRTPILVDFVLEPGDSGDIEKDHPGVQGRKDILRAEGLAANLPSGERYLSTTAAALRDSRGRTIAAIECVRDMTEYKKIEARLHRAETMEALGTLAGGVAHDLNNVLAVLVGHAELLLAKLPEGSSLTGNARHILQSSEKGSAIIQDLLILARRGVSVSEAVNLNKLISDYLASLECEKLRSLHGEVLVKCVLAEDLYSIRGSSIHLARTVMNLVSNAMEAIAGPGTVTIRTENRYVDYAISGYDDVQEGNYVILSISDTGSGIPAKDVGKIFEPFYTKKIMGRSGTGLGLAIVWGTVKDHHGYVEVKSDEGIGSTFTLYFPVSREEMIRERKKRDDALCMGRGESILIVDDMEFQRELAENLLDNLNYETATASSGEEAVAYIQNRHVDLILLDMIMDPGIDGLETLRRIREIRPDQKTIIVSGFAATERVRMAQELGAGEYVRKPYSLEQIGTAIRRALDRT
jgi:PAS domain S-box-containing protein